MHRSRHSWLLALAMLPALAALPARTAGAASPWAVARVGAEIRVGYADGAGYPQVAALHTDSSYLRLVPGPAAGWATSVVLLPSFWSQSSCPPGGLCQGGPVTASWSSAGDDLVLALEGTIGGLGVRETVRLTPPHLGRRIRAVVSAETSGTVDLDARPGERFKPLMLSSMRIDAQRWDAQAAGAGCAPLALPASGWVADPPLVAERLWLVGGSSDWKRNAPSVVVTLDRPLAVTGWVTPSTDPNDDNVGLWAAADAVLPAWSYTLDAMLPGDPGCLFLPVLNARP